MTKIQSRVLTGMFLAMIFGCTAVSLVKKDTSFSEKENRVLAQMPEVDLTDIMNGTFEKNYETYLSDQFFWRNGWIGVKTKAERAEGKTEINDVYFAKDGYLIEKHSGSFSTETAERNIRYLADFLASQEKNVGEGHVKAMIVPNAVEILKEKLPSYAVADEEDTYLKKLESEIPEKYLFDAKSILEAHKEEPIYYKTDHHWKTLASRYVYEAWAKSIGLSIVPLSEYREETLTTDFHGTIDAKVNISLPGDTIESYQPVTEVPYTLTYNHSEERNSLYDLSYLEGRDKYAVFFGGNQPLIEAKTKADTERKLLIIKDSYANCFLSFAMQDFAQIDIVDLRYFNENLGEYISDKEYTDILVLYNAAGFAEDASVAKLALATAAAQETKQEEP